MFTTSIEGGVFNISSCVGDVADMAAKTGFFTIGRWLPKSSIEMAHFLDMGKLMGTQHSLICGVGSGETTEVDKIIFLLNAFASSSLISLSSSVFPRHSQNSFEPPMHLAFVAASLCLFALREQSLDAWLPPLCVQQYRPDYLQTKLVIFRVLRMWYLPPFLSPFLTEPLGSPKPPW